jgi:hypothetical protein
MTWEVGLAVVGLILVVLCAWRSEVLTRKVRTGQEKLRKRMGAMLRLLCGRPRYRR